MAFANFDEFYPFYLGEHSNRTSRRLHVIGTVVALTQFAGAVLTQQPRLVLTGLLIGYGFAWIGHFFFEKNRPATFQYPLWSLMGDWRMFFETVSGQRKF